MKPSTIILSGVIVWSTSLGIAFNLGQSSHDSGPSSTSPVNANDTRQSIAARSDRQYRSDETSRSGEQLAEAEAIAAGLLSDYLNGGAITLDEAIANIGDLSTSEARDFITEALALPMSDPGRSKMVTALLKQLAQSQPEEAYALAANIGSLKDVERAKAVILEVWATNDPVKAFTWAQTALSGESRNTKASQMRAIFRGYAAINPQAAMAAAQSLPSDTRGDQRMRQELMAEIIETQVRQGDIEEAKSTIALLDDNSDVKEAMVRELVNEWARYDPQGAASYLDTMGDSASSNLKASLIYEWSEHDPSAAAKWLSGLDSEDPSIARAASSVIEEWARYDLEASGEWLNSLPSSEDLDRAVATYTMRAMREDPEGSFTWAESIFNDRMRSNMMQQVASNWKSDSPEEFQQFLDSSDYSEEEKTQLLESSGGGDRRGGRGGPGGGRGGRGGH